jgi:CubicO group peptidase (beta-lactamase class C family)
LGNHIAAVFDTVNFGVVRPQRMNRRLFIRNGLLGLGSALSPLYSFAETLTSSDPTTSFDTSELKNMEDFAEAYLRKYRVPGISLSISKDGSLKYSKAFGFADPMKKEPLTTKHRFRIASLSKSITSVCIFRLIEQAKLSLTDKVFGKSGLLAERFNKVRKNTYLEEVSIEHLLTHRVGNWDNEDDDPMFLNNKMTHDELIYWTLERRVLTRHPGIDYKYSNFGYCLLGRVIEEVTKKSYEDAASDLVFKPCGMTSLDLTGNTLKERRPFEVIYCDQNGYDPYGFNFRRMDSNGGWISTSEDLARFLVHVDGFPTKPDILNSDSINVMTTPSNSGYAKGWCVNRSNNWWHNGSLQGSLSFMVRADNGFCMVALINSRRWKSPMDGDLDKLTWDMIGQVNRWPSIDLFS